MSNIYFIKEKIKPTISLYDYTYTPDAFTVTYDGQDHTPNFVVKNPEGTTLTENTPDKYGVMYYINSNVENWTNAGTKKVTITIKGTDTDNFIYTNDWLGTLGNTRVIGWSAIIGRTTLTVIADPATKIAGTPDPVFTSTYTGSIGEEIPGFTGVLSREPGEAVGTYSILIGTLALADNDIFRANNYDMKFISDSFTIVSAPGPSIDTP